MKSLSHVFQRHLYDIVVLAASLPLAFLLRSVDSQPAFSTYIDSIILAAPISSIILIISYYMSGSSLLTWTRFGSNEMFLIVRYISLSILILSFTMFLLTRMDSIPRSLFVIQWAIIIILMTIPRVCTTLYHRKTVRTQDSENAGRYNWRPVLVIGPTSTSLSFVDFLSNFASPPCSIVGIVVSDGPVKERIASDVPILGCVTDLGSIISNLRARGVDRPTIVLAVSGSERIREIVDNLSSFTFVSGFTITDALCFLNEMSSVSVSDKNNDLSGIIPSSTTGKMKLKRKFDIFFALVLLAALSPVMAIVYSIVLVLLGRPAIFCQIRPGRGMKRFTLYKFRTMREPSAIADMSVDHFRETRIGRILRRLRLDELPQLFNILKGDMSFVGPRPLLTQDLPRSNLQTEARFSVRPGLTGWAQINGGRLVNSDYKVEMDYWYIQNMSMRLDIYIIVMTLATIFLGDRLRRSFA